ncbi:hypothetical protein J1N35_002516 [Gossypium stocksii]|uniref:Uncharacterized protein n=1 Tax=Gossypium stocksii TaxID=47602 RepID=A0A9D3WM41_9ROSI|nr:hypothetical protein J1N35_002516 [Gossypium stocksii]
MLKEKEDIELKFKRAVSHSRPLNLEGVKFVVYRWAMKSGLGINATNPLEEEFTIFCESIQDRLYLIASILQTKVSFARGEKLQHEDEVQSEICDGVEIHTTCEVNNSPIAIDESDTTNKQS